MSEPANPDNYYIYQGYIEHDGKYGFAKVKKWYEEGELKERILSFDGRFTEKDGG